MLVQVFVVKTFVRVAEVWVPSPDGTLLELGGGLFDAAPAVRRVEPLDVLRPCRGAAWAAPGTKGGR